MHDAITCKKYHSNKILQFSWSYNEKCHSEYLFMDKLLILLTLISKITLMIIENRALLLARSFALSRYNHRAVIMKLKARSFQNGSQIFLCFGVGN